MAAINAKRLKHYIAAFVKEHGRQPTLAELNQALTR